MHDSPYVLLATDRVVRAREPGDRFPPIPNGEFGSETGFPEFTPFPILLCGTIRCMFSTTPTEKPAHGCNVVRDSSQQDPLSTPPANTRSRLSLSPLEFDSRPRPWLLGTATRECRQRLLLVTAVSDCCQRQLPAAAISHRCQRLLPASAIHHCCQRLPWARSCRARGTIPGQ